MATITDNGITIKTLSEWKAALEAVYHAVDPEWDVSTATPDGQVIAALAEILTNADEAQLDSYNAADPDKATAQALDAILRLSNVERAEGTHSTATVQLVGTASTVVQAGTLIENSVTGTRWATDHQVVLGAGPTPVTVTCQTIGAQTAGVGELSKIATPVSGLESVSNAGSAALGRNPMTDPEARIFRQETISKPASNTIDSIVSSVATVSGVSHVRGYTNRNNSTDGNGIPGHGFSIIVKGGDDADIARAIYNKLNPGPPMFGGTNPVTVEVQSEVTTNSEDVTFGRAVDVPLYVQVNLIQTGEIPDSAQSEIKAAIVAYSLGNLFDGDSLDGHRKTGFRIAESISSGMLHTPVNYYMGRVGEGYVDSIYISRSPDPTEPGVASIGWNELATISDNNIEVTIS